MGRALTGACVAIALAAIVTGCGTGGTAGSNASASHGKELFTGPGARCGGCHTLADAGTRGTIGPNLDDAFARPRKEGFKESTIRNVILDQIRYPTKGSGMPADLVEGEDAKDVAAYVASVAARTPAGGAPKSATGQGLYASLGCQGCHTLDGTKATGPTFKGLFGKKEKLTNGQSVTADEQYLLDSILDPDKQILQGYAPGVMTSVIRKGQVSQADAKKLVAFIKER